MRVLSRITAGLTGLLVAALVTACGGDPPPTGPSPVPGTIGLTGNVHVAGNRSIPVIGARVEVVGGGAAGLATATDWYGSYSLSGVPVDADLRVSKEGYDTSVASVRQRTGVTPSRGTLDVPLAWAGPPGRDLSGIYTLTLIAACPVTSTLPAPLRTRQYSATVVQRNASQVEVQLGGAAFEIELSSGKGDRFPGRIVAEGILFDLEGVYDWGPHPDVLERLPDGSWLEVSGRTLARHSETGLTGTLHGSFVHYPVTASGGSWYIYTSCDSDSHRFALSR